MKRKYLWLLVVVMMVLITVFAWSFFRGKGEKTADTSIRIPRVLILTTGKDGTGTLPEGVLLVMESFTSQGAIVRLNTRDALLDKDYLMRFDVLVMLTAAGYHDADRQYSLTYLDDIEQNMIRGWVEQGGVLIAGDNIGRNLRNGTDRISIYGRLEPENWPLANCFGVMLSERDMAGFHLGGDLQDSLRGLLIPPLGEGAWILVPDSLFSGQAKVLAYWTDDSLRFPALIMNRYGKGMGVLLPSSYLLHPANNGGHWSSTQIDLFCQMIMDAYWSRFPLRSGFMPWPEGKPAAFAVSLNSDGNATDYGRIFSLLKLKNITPSLFVNGTLDEGITQILSSRQHNLQSNGWKKTNMRDLSFSETVFQIKMNEQAWQQTFTGFRFPYTLNSVSGMEYLQRKGYLFESSIGVDHTQSFAGSLFPYHLPVFIGETYQVLDLLEISPVARDDYYYFRMIQESQVINEPTLQMKAMLFNDYLLDFWKNNALRTGGVMVFLGHPLFTGHSETTLRPLKNLIDTVERHNGWITTMEEIALRWKAAEDLEIHLASSAGSVSDFLVRVSLPGGKTIEKASIVLPVKPLKVNAFKGKASVQQANGRWLIIFDASEGQEITFSVAT